MRALRGFNFIDSMSGPKWAQLKSDFTISLLAIINNITWLATSTPFKPEKPDASYCLMRIIFSRTLNNFRVRWIIFSRALTHLRWAGCDFTFIHFYYFLARAPEAAVYPSNSVILSHARWKTDNISSQNGIPIIHEHLHVFISTPTGIACTLWAYQLFSTDRYRLYAVSVKFMHNYFQTNRYRLYTVASIF